MKTDKIKTHKNVIHKTSFIQFLINKKAERLKAMAKYMRKKKHIISRAEVLCKIRFGLYGFSKSQST